MNVNTIQATPSFTNYIHNELTNNCDPTYNIVPVVAKSYLFDMGYAPANSKLCFPISVKTYQPQLFNTYITNTTPRSVNNTQGYIVGQKFTTGNSLTNVLITFTADPHVKLPLDYAISFYGQIWIGNMGHVIFRIEPTVDVERYIKPTCETVIKFYDSKIIRNRAIFPVMNTDFSGTTTMLVDRYVVITCRMIYNGTVYIPPNCKVSWWIRKMYVWEDCQTWS